MHSGWSNIAQRIRLCDSRFRGHARNPCCTDTAVVKLEFDHIALEMRYCNAVPIIRSFKG